MKYLLSILIVTNLFASTYTLDYIGELSLFGKVANATITYKNNGKKYHIKVIGTGSGIVARLTNNRRYIYESIGDVNGTSLIPKHYIETEITPEHKKIKDYNFEYDKSQISVLTYEESKIYRNKVDITNLSIIRVSHIEKKEKQKVIKNIYYDDMISIFFNKRNKLLEMKKNESKVIYAVGSKDTQKGIDIELINIQNNRYIYRMKLKKSYLEDGSTEAEFILDKDNFLYETSLNGIMFFGNAVIKRVK
jgi:hypothetical protein